MDEIVTYKEQRHIVIYRKGVYYKLDVYKADSDGKVVQVSIPELYTLLQQIVEMADGKVLYYAYWSCATLSYNGLISEARLSYKFEVWSVGDWSGSRSSNFWKIRLNNFVQGSLWPLKFCKNTKYRMYYG